MKKRVLCSMLLGSVLLGSSVTASANPSQLYFFGDSLTDAGNAANAPVTNQGGPVWTQVLGQFFGLSIAPSTQGGTDYAYAGARTTGNVPNPSTDSQVDMLITNSNGHLDSHALYFLFAGLNDIVNDVFNPIIGQTAANNIVNTTKKLINFGGQYILVSNLPDVQIPAFNDLIYPVIKAQIDGYNAQLLSSLNGLSQDIIQVDARGLANAIFANPVGFGFDADAPTVPCADDNSACTGKIFISDGTHFTTQTHAALADYYYSVLTAPYFFSTMGNVAASVANNQLRLVNHKLFDFAKTDKAVNLFLIGSLMPSLKPPQAYSYDANNTYSVILGLTRNLTDNVLIGGAFGHNAGKTDIEGAMGHYDNDHNIVNLFVDYKDDKWFVSVLANYAWLNFNSIQRHISIGSLSNYASGTTNGHQYGFAANAIYNVYSNGSIKTGPLAELYYQHARIDGYTEQGPEFYANMHYQSRTYNQTNGGLGWILNHEGKWQNTPISSNVFAIVNQQWTPQNSRINFNLTSLPGSHGALTVVNQSPTYVTLGFNSTADFDNGTSVSLGYYAQPGEDDINQQAVNLTVSKKLA